ncbi:MAG: hypothetical protein R3249_04420 [Nitriliruptorales bacterium]|nr:hypothetical protein [Nitriliruptorales bacterium]
MNDRRERLETLAAWVAGELDDAARAEAEALLASDPEVAADLERLTGLDGLLAAHQPPPPPAGSHERLLAALEPVIREQLGPDPSESSGWLRNTLARLREAPLTPRLAAGAAVLVVIAGAGIGLSQIGQVSEGFDDVQADAGTVATDSDLESAPQAALPEAYLATGGVYDEASALALLGQYAGQADRWSSDDAGAPPPEEPADGSAVTSVGEADQFAFAESCTAKLFESEDGVELHRELATYKDEPAIVTVIERPDGDLELWVLAQSDCGALLFHETR